MKPYEDQLKTIFIVSSVNLEPSSGLEAAGYESEDIQGLRVRVAPSEAMKCERCWTHDPSVGNHDRHATLCSRCVEALREMEITEA
jgi:isoleucyl-tRNA synthetase